MNLKMPMAFALFSIILIGTTSALNTYETHYYTSDGSNPTLISGVPFKSTVSNCTLTLGLTSNLTGSSIAYSIINEYYSPISSKIGMSYRALSGNYSCFRQGNITGPTSSTLESKATITRSGGYLTLGSLDVGVICGTSDDWLNLTMGYGQYDSAGNSYNSYFQHACVTPYSNNLFLTSSNFNYCETISDSYINPANFTSDNCPGQYPRVSWAMPFVTGESGQIEYQINLPYSLGVQLDYGYYKPSDASGTYVSVASLGLSNKLTLERNTQYIFFIGGVTPSAGVTTSTVNLNISVNIYSPEWECSEWSECELGSQYRACIDPLGKIPAKIEYQGCVSTALAEANLGFEQYESQSTVKACGKYWFVTCFDEVQSITDLQKPKGWTLSNTGYRHFADMTSDDYSEGSRSLKMWYNPPGLYPQAPGYTVCNYSSMGFYPSIYLPVSNSTLFISYNITFPSSYMTLQFDSKKCLSVPVKYDGWCGKECYGINGSCDYSELKSSFLFRLYDTTNNQIMVDYYGSAKEEWETKYFDISTIGIIAGRTYNMVFAVNPENEYESYGHCVYFDAVKYAVRTDQLPCDNPTCQGIDRYIPTLLNGSCVYTVEFDSPYCLSGKEKEDALNYNDYCIPNTNTLNHYNNDTKKWEKTENSTQCIDQEAENTIYDPIPIFDAFKPALDGYGLGFILYLLSPMMMAIYIAIGISAYLLYKVGDKIKSDYFGLVVFLAVLAGESLIGIFPIWLVLVLIVISGMGIAFMQSRG